MSHASSLGSKTLAYTKTGEGSPVLIVHGIGGHEEDWAGLSETLASRHAVYAVDMLGFGGSSKTGAGNLGTALGKRLAERDHDIVVGFARDPLKVAEAARAIGGKARPGSPVEAAAHGDVAILATPWGVTPGVMEEIAQALRDKIVWDATNPFAPDRGELLIGTTTSAGEEVAKRLPRSRVVKAIPPFAELLASSSLLIGGRSPGAFVCSDDAEARRIVLALMSDIGVDAIDAGPLKRARFTEPLGMLVTNLAYVQGMGARISSTLLRESRG